MPKEKPTETIILNRRPIPVGKWLYRFLTGLHMDGKNRKNYRTGKVLPQYKDYFWNRYSRPRRLLWRLVISWLFIAILIGLREERAVTTFLMLACVPFIGAYIIRQTKRHYMQTVKVTSAEGAEERYVTLRPKYARRLTKLRFHIRVNPPGDKPVPPDWERPIRAQMTEPVQQLRMPLQPPRDLSDLLAEQGSADSREATHKRNARRGLRNA